MSDATKDAMRDMIGGLKRSAIEMAGVVLGARVPINDEDTVGGYHLFTGGGFGPDADVGQEVYHDLKAEDAPKTVEALLKAYLAHRASPDETFLSFARRHDGESLRKLADAQVSA